MRRLAAAGLAVFLAACASPPKTPPATKIFNEPWTLAKKSGWVMRPFGALEAILPLERQFDGRPAWEASSYWQAIAQYRSYVSDERGAIEAFARSGAAEPFDAPLPEDLRGEDAVDAILAAAKDRRAVFLNESHHIPRDRAFSTRLLGGLHALGYRWFAAETLWMSDPELEARGYPAAGKTGGYVHEPFFGELLREALRLGFHVVPYEDERPCAYDEKRPWFCQNFRETGQAENLRDRILEKDPEAKLFVHAGFGHIVKKKEARANGEWTPMAFVFRELTGIDPLCVDQTQFAAPGSPAAENALARLKPSDSVVLFSSSGAWSMPPGRYDLQILHPETRYEHGRPDWIGRWTNRKLVPVPPAFEKTPLPFSLEAFSVLESSQAVPWDRIVVRDRAAAPALMLPPGGYTLRATDASGRSLKEIPLIF